MAEVSETLSVLSDSSSLEEETYDWKSILSAGGIDFLVRNNGDQVGIADLSGKMVAIYFCKNLRRTSCMRFIPIFVEVYIELRTKGDFEVVFVSMDSDEESFKESFSKMPWLAIPFPNSEIHIQLENLFYVYEFPYLVILDGNGKVLSNRATMKHIEYHGAEVYPFTLEKIEQIKEKEESARRNQSLRTLLVTKSRNYLISSNGSKVLISDIEGNVVALYFCRHKACREFTPKLVEMYKKLKDRGENFEAVLISLDNYERDYQESLKSIPFLAVPFDDEICERLVWYFNPMCYPKLVIIGPDGKTLSLDAVEHVEDHGIQAYPFTPEMLEQLEEMERRRLESQTLESLLLSGKRDFVIQNDGVKVPVSELSGKTILLYFAEYASSASMKFLPKLMNAYNVIKDRGGAFEIIFISDEDDQESFDEFFSFMPWLALPFGDERKEALAYKFNLFGIPLAVAIGPTGQIVAHEAMNLLLIHGPDAFPFTEEHLKEVEAQIEESVKEWPKKMKHGLHPKHEIKLQRRELYRYQYGLYTDYFGQSNLEGRYWFYYCEECNFCLEPEWALEELFWLEDNEKGETGGGDDHGEAAEEVWLSCGDVCHCEA